MAQEQHLFLRRLDSLVWGLRVKRWVQLLEPRKQRRISQLQDYKPRHRLAPQPSAQLAIFCPLFSEVVESTQPPRNNQTRTRPRKTSV